jgi:hypothetical protein
VRTQAGVEVTLDATTSFHLDPARDVVSYAWELGDGATATGDVVTHVYATPQTLPLRYVPTITVTDDQGIPHTQLVRGALHQHGAHERGPRLHHAGGRGTRRQRADRTTRPRRTWMDTR